MNPRNLIGTNIKALRKSKNITQEELAAKLNLIGVSIDRPMISKIENRLREINDFEIEAIANVLETNIENLFKRIGDK